MADPLFSDAARLLAEVHAARGLVRRKAEVDWREQAETAVPISASALWAHVRRAPQAPVSFEIERALRTNPAVLRKYRTMLACIAVISAPEAIAAASGGVSQRRIGPVTITIDEPIDAARLILISGLQPPMPGVIEVLLGERSLRLALPEPIGETVVLAVDPAISDIMELMEMLRDPRAEIFLIPIHTLE